MSTGVLTLLDEMNQAGRISYSDYSALHDAISALIPSPPTGDEREAVIAAVDEILNPFGVASSAQENLVLEAAQKWANRHRGPITDEAPRLTVLTGGAATGKTTRARAWFREDPEGRRVTGDAAQARLLLAQGYDVILDLDGGMPFPGDALRGVTYTVINLTHTTQE